MFSFIPDRRLLSRKCELIHYGGGSCLPSSALYYFSFTAPTVPVLVRVERRYSQLPICNSVVRGLPADKWPGGEVQGESCQSQSALCCRSNLRRYGGGGCGYRGREKRRCSQNISLKSSLKSANMYRFSPCSTHSISLCQNIP